MSLLSTLKSFFSGPKATVSQPAVQPASAPSQAPKAQPSVTIPATTEKRRVNASRNAHAVDPGLKCDFFDAQGSKISALPDQIEIRRRVNLTQSKELVALPAGLTAPSIVLSGCSSLKQLPQGLDVVFLDLAGCTALETLPADLKMRGGRLSLRNCAQIDALPDDLGEVCGLDLSGCSGISRLPQGLTVTSWMDITGTGIRSLPAGFEHVGLRRDGDPVPVDVALAG